MGYTSYKIGRIFFEDDPKLLMIDLAEDFWHQQILLAPRHQYDKPGAALMRLKPEIREVLKELKSEDIKDVRWPLIDGLRNCREI